MFYEPKNGHGLAKNPFNSLILPRPIGWISTVDAQGRVNLAPYSFFNAVSYTPPTIMFSSGHGQVEDDGMKDTLRNVLETGEFVHNVVTWDNREAMNQTSATTSKDIDEMALAGLTPVASDLVKPPRVWEAPVHMECKLLKTVELPNTEGGNVYTVVFGEVIGIHIDDRILDENGIVDIDKFRPLGRLGYQDYTRVDGETAFTMDRPDYKS